MPYSVDSDNLPSNVKKMPKKKKAQWVAVWNETYNSCVEEGGKVSSCETKAFKAANGSVSQTAERTTEMGETSMLRKVWDRFLDYILGQMEQEKQEEIERAIGFGRLREQLWSALDNSEQAAAGWAYPIDVFVGDDGASLFSIVTQNGKLYQVPLQIEQDNLSLGEWTQVTEVFEPVQQNRFTIRRQADGRHRWLFIAATSVINRVGEIDSSELFDSFIEHAADTGEYPRVDFYHMGDADPKAWEFGTADYLAREGCCYIATGLFDEDHPLAKATIRAYEEHPEVWGCSIEFYAKTEAEVLVLDPKVQVPVYKSGKNTRISIVKEVDAAGLFTRIGITEEKTRMKRDIKDKLVELFGEDEDGLATFIETVDTVNRTIKDDKLIHRKKNPQDRPEEDDEENEDEEDEEEEEDTTQGQTVNGEQNPEIELDDDAVRQIAETVAETAAFVEIKQSLALLREAVDKLTSAKEEDAKEISRLKKVNAKMAQRLEAVEAEETEKQQTWAEDLPRKKSIRASYRPRDEYAAAGDEEKSMAEIADETLRKLPSY